MKIYNEEDIIYHYCSVETFFKIIESKSFRFSNTKYMNDSTDSKWFNKLLNKGIENLKAEGHTCEQMFEKMGESDFHACCFSKNGDDLTQWKAYADDGKGVAIGILKPSCTQNDNHFDLIELKYDNQDYEIAKFIELIKNKTAHEIDVEKFIDSRYSLSATLKHPCFKCEDEVRLLYSPPLPDINTETGKNNFLHRNFGQNYIVKNNNIVDFYDIKFALIKHIHSDNTHLFLIQKILLGPKCLLEINQLKDFLRCHVKTSVIEQIDIEKSELPYR